MPKTEAFDTYADRYDAWYEEHQAAFQSEVGALLALLPVHGEGLEIGVGTGRFAAALGLKHGVDPSPNMRRLARQRGITVREGVAEDLPYPAGRFDKILMVATLCYLDDPLRAFREGRRVLRPGGAIVVGFIDRESPLGQKHTRSESPFYQEARFHTVPEVVELLGIAGFEALAVRQALFTDDPSALHGPDPMKESYGEGGFVAVRGLKPV